MKLIALTSLAVLSLVACAADPGAVSGSSSALVEPPNCGETDAGPAPAPAHEVVVTANGTGCAGREFVGSISADEKTLTIAPKAVSNGDGGTVQAPGLFDHGVEVGQAFSIKDCSFGIDISNTAGRSYAARALDVHGYAILDKAGMSAKQTAKLYFQGNPATASELATEVAGPYDGVTSFQPTIESPVWSPCNATRRLNAQLRSVAYNNADKSGTSLLEVNPSISVELSWRSCE